MNILLKIKSLFNKSVLMHTLYALAFIGILAFLFFGDSGLYQLHSLRNTKKKLVYQIRENERKIKVLENEKKKLTNPDYLESIVRKELGYVKNGEVIYQVIQ